MMRKMLKIHLVFCFLCLVGAFAQNKPKVDDTCYIISYNKNARTYAKYQIIPNPYIIQGIN